MEPLKVLSGICLAAAILAGCGGSLGQRSGTVVPMPADVASTGHVRHASSGNIYWNKHELRLPYPSTSYRKATLTYWAPNGFYLTPLECKRGGQISVTAHHQGGNPSGYMHVVYWFKALTPGPDRCGISAVLSGTGSPPIAPIALRING
jgi:hypothetical protein